MDKESRIKKLSDRANVSYEDAKKALENSEWDILDAMLYLENNFIVERPSIGEFYSNKQSVNNNNNNNNPVTVLNLNKEHEQNKNNSQWQHKKGSNRIFEVICEKIDICNNFFIEVRNGKETFFKISLTVLIILLFFMFGILIPTIVVALIFDIEFFVTAKGINQASIDNINKSLANISRGIKHIKAMVKKEFKK